MKNKKIFISLVASVLVFSVCFGLYSQNKSEKETFSVALLDAATTQEGVIYPEETEIVEVEEEETPAAALVIGGSTSTRNLNSTELDKIRTKLITKVNAERKTGASNITVTDTSVLKTTGNVRAKEIVQVWSHTRPNGKEWETVLSANGVNMTNIKAGEDLAKVELSAKASYDDAYLDQIASTIHNSLMGSTTHKAVILNKDYKQVGAGLYSEVVNGKVTVYVTEHFKNDNSSTAKKAVTTLTVTGIPSTAAYTGKQIKPTVTVKNGSTTLKNGTDYTVTYGTNKATGAATVKIAGKGNYSGSVTKTFYIVPKKVTLSSVKSSAKKKVTVKYTKATGASGYQIAYSTKKTSGFKTTTATAASKTLSGLTSKKTYYVKVRPYKTVSGKKYYGAYTAVKSVKVK